MLLRTCFIVLLIAVVGDTIIHAAMALGSAALHHRALTAARAEIIRGTTLVQQSLTAQSAIPQPVPTCVASDANGCVLLATTQIDLVTPPSPAPMPSACPQSACTAYAQGNDSIAEGRVGASIATSVTSVGGVVLARRTASVTFRTFAVPPYAALVGSLDDTQNAIAPNGVGDDGGGAPQGSSAGTLIDVLDRNAQSGVLTPANVWIAHTHNAPLVTSAWDP